jgi:hypothetical protein
VPPSHASVSIFAPAAFPPYVNNISHFVRVIDAAARIGDIIVPANLGMPWLSTCRFCSLLLFVAIWSATAVLGASFNKAAGSKVSLARQELLLPKLV